MFRTIILSIVISFISGNELKAAEWLPLECQQGHKYLYSEMMLSWAEARAECTLYGGWLLTLGSLQEQNCLMKAGISLPRSWYWTDATDFEKKGVWVHDNDDSNELQWINHKWNCDGNGGTNQFYSHGGDAILFGIRNGLPLVN